MPKTITKEIKLLQGQANILTNFKARILAAIAGCVAGDTLIDTPTGRCCIADMLGWREVLAWTGEGVTSANAYVFLKGKAQLYRVETKTGKAVEVTENHYLLVHDGRTFRWRSVAEIMPMLAGQKAVSVASVYPCHANAKSHVECLPYPQESSPGLCQLAPLSDVHYSCCRVPDYQGHCCHDCRPDDGQPQRAVDTDLKAFPLRCDVLLCNQRLSRTDDPGISQGYNRSCQSLCPHAKNSLVPSLALSPVERYHASPCTSAQSLGHDRELLQGYRLTSVAQLPTASTCQSHLVSSSFELPYHHLQSLLYHDNIVNIKPTKVTDYYDMFVPEHHNYLAHGMIHHNTGGGKTMTGYWWLHSRMEAYPGNTWGVAEPTYKMLDRVILNSSDPGRPSLEQYLKSIGHHPVFSRGEGIIKTDFGQIYLYTADNPNTMQGAPVKGFWLDEGGQMCLLAHETALQRISMMQGQELITTTPYNLGWLLTEVVRRKSEEIAVEQWRSIDRPGYPRESYEFMKQTLPEWRFRMLFDAQFEKPAGLIYNTFNENVCVIDRFPIPTKWLIYAGHDFGPDNPAAIFTAQDTETGNFYHFHEYLPGAGVSVHERVEEWKVITKGYNVIRRVGGAPAEEETRQAYNAHGWIITAPKIKKVEPQIDKVISMHQLNKIYVFKDLEHYLDEKRTFSRKLNDSGEVTEDIDNEARFHLMAAERYLMSDFIPETIETTREKRPVKVW